MSTLGDLTVPNIDQSGPYKTGEFTYIDISSIDNKLKRIVEPKCLPASAAPSRAKQRLQPGDVMVSMTRPNLNAVAIVSPDLEGAVGSTGFHVLRAVGGIESRWLLYAVQTNDFVEAMSSLVQGALYPAVRPKDIRAFGIEAPPLDEQRLIVAEIEKQFSRLDEAVANLKRVRANLKRYKASVLKAAVESKLTEAWRKQHPNVEPASKLLERILTERRAKWNRAGNYREPAVPDTTGLPLLPNNWKWASLDQLLLNITDGDHQPPPQTDSGVPFLVIGNVRSGKLEFEDTRFVSRQYADAVNIFRKPTRGDILYTLVGSFGIALRVDADREFCIQRHIGVLRSHKLSPTSYLVHVLNSLFVFSQATNVATGTAQKTVPLAGLRRFSIPLAPLAEQQQIVAEVERRLSVIEELEAAVQANLTRAERMRQSILQQAFSGRLLSASTRSPSLKTSKGIVAETSSFGSSIR